MPAATTLTIACTSQTPHPVAPGPATGYGGKALVEELEPRKALPVERPDGARCKLTFD